ncbi:MAG: DUF5053 domain-containing protein [Muribaculaceae bacterium]|nr:DUF5053 domain-containing protein [Muribaculaceae bacterium]MDE6534169.1 DUF5053 domain-containing protein [Muribaculaceae bacterium]MDE6771720.1 DUF5053 domain-containing protein [Muribaculaceae bacterium]
MTLKQKADSTVEKVRFMKESDLLKALNGTYIAERFFGKSGSWFSQKINNHEKNGKPVEFSEEEIQTLKEALVIISLELQDLADEL